MIGVTKNGGRTWRRVTLPRLTKCTGGKPDAASDPWVSAGPRRTIYFAGASGFVQNNPPAVEFLASASHNGGRTWSSPAAVAGPKPRLDKEAITANPTRVGHAYMVWVNRDMPTKVPSRSYLRFSRTTNGGKSWSRPSLIDRAPSNGIHISAQILVLPGGALVAVYSRGVLRPGGTLIGSLYVRRSTDEGRTWTRPVLVHFMVLRRFKDPQTKDELPNQNNEFFGATVGPGGYIYVVWDQNQSPRTGSIRFARSPNGGNTWSPARALPGVRAFSFEPTVAVDAHHTVGVLWYDMRRDQPGDGRLTTDVWFAHSSNGGTTWRQRHVAGPFDLRTAPRPSGFPRLGEYQGLTSLGPHGFAAVFTMARFQARNGPTDIFFARVEPQR